MTWKVNSRQLSKYFTLHSGDFHATTELNEGVTPLISCGDTNNGLVGYFDIPPEKRYKNAITVAYNGSWPLLAKFHPYEFGAKDDVAVLKPLHEMKTSTLFYVASQLNAKTWRYNYGRKCFYGKLKSVEILVPLLEESKIDEKAIADIFPANITSLLKDNKATGTGHVPMAIFDNIPLTEICDVKRKYAPYMKEICGDERITPYVSTTEKSNGVAMMCDSEPNFSRNTVTVSLDGRCGDVFFQFEDYIAGEKTAVLRLRDELKIPKSFKPYLLLYIASMIRRMAWRYHYGRKLSEGRLKKFILPLPIDDKGKVDVQYIKSLVEACYGWNLMKAKVQNDF